MSISPPPDRAAAGRARIAARARRVALIRRRVAAATVAAFVLAWGVIVFDGSMGSSTLASTGAASATATPSPTGTASSSGATASSTPAPVTTGQS
jgi:hypothetical protein